MLRKLRFMQKNGFVIKKTCTCRFLNKIKPGANDGLKSVLRNFAKFTGKHLCLSLSLQLYQKRDSDI